MTRNPPDLGDLADRVRSLIRDAEAAGKPATWLTETADALIDALLELGAYRRGEHDPRRQRTLELAQRVRRLHAQGVGIPELCERFDRRPRTIYRLLAAPLLRGAVPRETSSSSRHNGASRT